MTVILGINLTDSIILAADTRVTQKRGNKIVAVHDDMLKIDKANGLFMACAGDAGLAGHIVRELHYQAFTRRGIEYVRSSIEAWVGPVADQYWQSIGQSTFCTILMAGSSHQRKQSIPIEVVREFTGLYMEEPFTLHGNSAQKMMAFTNIGNDPHAPDRIRMRYKETMLFSVTVSHAGVEVVDCPIGSHLIYGPGGLVHEDIKPEDCMRFEFVDSDAGLDSLYSAAYIKAIVENRQLVGVGSDVVAMRVLPNNSATIITGEVHRVVELPEGKFGTETISDITVIEGRINRVSGGAHIPLRRVSEVEQTSISLSLI